ncbi:ABC transporter substrate-binding protein [Streptomyces sp. NPDC057697]|uniref:ABC transporter substrate-binding protein n=1 Tax=Streptomyces sp. NPDC057697 TaxID=3346219 RepID=UPI00368B5382
MKRPRHVVAAAVSAAVIGLGTGACSVSDDALSGAPARTTPGGDGPAVDGGTLKVGLDRPFTKIDPADTTLTSMPVMILANALFDPLMVNDDNGAVKPFLARSFTPDTDGKVWKLELREGVRFSDGKPLDGQAVVDHVTRLSKPESKCACAVDAATIKNMKVTGPTGVTFTLTSPNATFPSLFTRSLGYVSEAPVGDGPAIGSGPYTVESVQPGVSLTAVRNPSYWGAKAHADKVVYRVLPDADSRYQSVRSGDADIVWTETPAQLKQASGDGLRTATGPSSTSTMLFNTQVAPFDDPRVRRAVQYAIDRESVEKVAYLGQGKVSDGPIGSASAYRRASTYPARDVAKARELLAEAGHPDLSFEYIADSRPEGQQRATAIQQMLGEAGITMTIKPVDPAANGTALMQRKFQVLDFVTSMFGDTDTALSSLFPTKAPYNFTGYADSEVDEAIARGRASMDPARRAAAYNEASKTIVEDAPVLFLTENPAGFVASSRVGGLPDLSKRSIINVSPAGLWVKR